jgi:predicted N-acetyltransferase YhbS
VTGWRIRDERPAEAQVIAALTEAAFREAEHTDGTEGAIPAKLRESGALTVSLVADADGELVGHVALSPVALSDGSDGWYGLGPVSVIPARQGDGIGSALIREGIARLGQLGARGCVVLGEPAFYGRFGFRHDPRLVYPGPPPEYFQRIVFNGAEPQGEVSYSRAFG